MHNAGYFKSWLVWVSEGRRWLTYAGFGWRRQVYADVGCFKNMVYAASILPEEISEYQL